MSDYDVIVVGAGNAALAAAVSAWESGAKKTLVLEKAPRNMRGGNTHWAGASLRFAFDDPQELAEIVPGADEEYFEGVTPYPREKFMDDLMKTTNGRTDPDLSRLLVETSKDIVVWMTKVGGIEMEPAFNSKVVVNGKPVWGYGIAVRCKHEGEGLSRGWFEAVEKRGIEIRYGAAAIALVEEDGVVTGVRVRSDEGTETIRAKAVVLGCGGFEANTEMRTRYMGPEMGGAKVRGTPHNQGDGLRMAFAIGAMPWGQYSGCHATPISADWGEFAPREMTDKSNRLSYTYGVMINRRGLRFVDEGENLKGYTYAKYGRAVLGQPGALAYQIFDDKVVHLLEPRYSTSKPIKADTLEALVDQLDIDDKPQAIRTLEAYNAVAHDESDGFNPQRLDGLSTTGLVPEKTNWALKLDKPPYYAYSATGGITFTFGGLRVSTESEVIGTEFRPIPGLFACGELVGGLFYDNYPAGSGLISGAIFGRAAGRNAAKLARASGGPSFRPGAESEKRSNRPAEEWVP